MCDFCSEVVGLCEGVVVIYLETPNNPYAYPASFLGSAKCRSMGQCCTRPRRAKAPQRGSSTISTPVVCYWRADAMRGVNFLSGNAHLPLSHSSRTRIIKIEEIHNTVCVWLSHFSFIRLAVFQFSYFFSQTSSNELVALMDAYMSSTCHRPAFYHRPAGGPSPPGIRSGPAVHNHLKRM